MGGNLIIASVGTSLLQKKDKRQVIKNEDISIVADVLRQDWLKNHQVYSRFSLVSHLKEMLSANCNDHQKAAFERFYGALLSLNPAEEIAKRNAGPIGEPDELPAELSTLYLLFYPQSEKTYTLQPIERESNHVVLLASDTPEGVFCARCIADYLKQREEFKPLLRSIEIEIISGLVGEKSALFQTKGIPNLIETSIRLIKHTTADRVVLSVTAGYKGTLPYLALLGLLYPNVDTVYLFEASNAVVEFPKLPIDFDVIDWNNHRGIIKTLLAEGSNRQLLEFLPPAIRRLFDDLPHLGKAVRDRVEEKEQGLSFYGSGRILSELIDDESTRTFVERWLAQSQYIWHGDLIAEAVDHARGHAQRLHELAFQLLGPVLRYQREHKLPPLLCAKELALLAYTLWIHDIGHSGRTVNLCDDNGKELSPPFPIDISAFPSLVRDLHHYSAYLMLTKGEEWKLFFPPSVFGSEIEAKNIAVAVATCYLYHRGKMELLTEKKTDDPGAFFETALNVRAFFAQPLEDFITKHHPQLLHWTCNGRLMNWRLLVALQRFIDGCDVQRERTYTTELNMRKMALAKREITSELHKLKSLEKVIRHHLNAANYELYNDWIRIFSNANWLDRYLGTSKDLMKLQKDFEKAGIDGHSGISLYDLLRTIFKRRANGTASLVDILFEEYLACANRIVWKHSPLPHFKKHEKVDQVFITTSKDFPRSENRAFKFWINLIAGRDESGYEISRPDELNDIFEEIRGEYQKGGVKEILEGNSIFMSGCRVHTSETIFARQWNNHEWSVER